MLRLGLIFSIAVVLSGVFALFVDHDGRKVMYLTQYELKSHKDDLEEAIDGKIERYQSLASKLSDTHLAFGILCGFGFTLLITRRESVKLPVVDVEIKRSVACAIFPLLLLYGWLSFGYSLNLVIDYRIVSMRLINAKHEIERTDSNYVKKHYTITRASDLEDHGFADMWFWNFVSQSFPLFSKDWYAHIGPKTAAVWYAALYGFAHSLVFLTPYSIQRREDGFFLWEQLVVGLCAIAFIASHLTFSLAGKHWNWWQILVGVFSFIFVMSLSKLARGKGVKPTGDK